MNRQQNLNFIVNIGMSVISEGEFHSGLLETMGLKEKKIVDKMLNGIRKVYDEMFSDEELEFLVAMYSTPIGIAIMKKIPVIADKAAMIGFEIGMEIDEIENPTPVFPQGNRYTN